MKTVLYRHPRLRLAEPIAVTRSFTRPQHGRRAGAGHVAAAILLGVLLLPPAPAAEDGIADEDNTCILCHGNPDVWEKETLHLLVKPEDLATDIHWKKGLRCHDCHGGDPTSTNPRDSHAVGEPNGLRMIAKPWEEPAFCGHCHSDAKYMQRFQPQAKTEQVAQFWAGAHGQHLLKLKQAGDDKAPNATACLACHPKHKMGAVTDPQAAIHPSQLADTCAKCHKEQRAAFAADVHGRAVVKDNQGGETRFSCTHCHGRNMHELFPVRDPRSPVFVDNQRHSCGQCHDKSLATYLESVHGYGLVKAGLVGTAICSSCHGAHGIYKHLDPRSTLHASHVATTCAKCHRLIEERLEQSVHGRGKGPGGATEKAAPGGEIKRSASCTDCHQGHDRPRVDSLRFRLTVSDSCGTCHKEWAYRYGFSLHGELTEVGYGPAANCADCHGAHDIQKVKETASKVSELNRPATCRKCHPNAADNLITGFDPHADHHNREKDPLLYWVYVVLMTFLIGTFAVFGIHSVIWFFRELVNVLRHGRPRTFVPGNVAYVRFTFGHRIAHALLLISFLGLAATGLPLKYSHMPWAQTLAVALGGFGSTNVWHRIFGMVNVACLVLYTIRLIYRLVTRPRRGESRQSVVFGPDSPVPTWRDLKDFFAMVRWFFGRGPKPAFERWAYWEKVDFWGAAADSVIIGLTGLILWFPNLFCLFLPGETVNVAKLIHSTQALLATGFVFAIHFFSVWLRPEKFPLDMAMFTGVVSEADLREERPAYYQRLQEEGRLEHLRTVVPPRRVIILSLLGGYFALTIGMALLVGIVAATFSS